MGPHPVTADHDDEPTIESVLTRAAAEARAKADAVADVNGAPDLRSPDEVLAWLAGRSLDHVKKSGYPVDMCTFEIGAQILAVLGMSHDEAVAEIKARIKALLVLDSTPRVKP